MAKDMKALCLEPSKSQIPFYASLPLAGFDLCPLAIIKINS